MKKYILLFLCISLLSGCGATVYRQYQGEPLSEDKIAVLEHPDPQHSYFILEDVDGKWRGMGLISRYELLPGKHSITCSIHDPQKTSKKVTVYFDAEAGKRYLASEITDGNRWTVVIRDKSTDKIVSYVRKDILY